ncbi:helix-turn-helix transcriptional regulator [Rhizobium croatiense]|uniref:helix-turn-helix transcriptional regulator n=1 Tax=Rhizobium croatiense TaxID=2867516 RepID=UPI00268FAE8F
MTGYETPALLTAAPSSGTTDPADAARLRDAVRRQRKVAITYEDAQGSLSDRTIWPIAIVYFDGVRVLAAWCEHRSAFRHFRIDRLHACTVLEERYPGRRQAIVKVVMQRARGLATPFGKSIQAFAYLGMAGFSDRSSRSPVSVGDTLRVVLARRRTSRRASRPFIAWLFRSGDRQSARCGAGDQKSRSPRDNRRFRRNLSGGRRRSAVVSEGMTITLKVHRDPCPSTAMDKPVSFRLAISRSKPGELRLLNRYGNGFSRGSRRAPLLIC